MTGYELTERLRKTRRRHRLSAATQALYYELVAICNEEGWPDEFKCSNDELIAALQVSEKSLITYRLELIQAGLIFYLSGKSKKKIGVYSFSKEFLNGCKFYNQSDSLTGSQSVSQSVSRSGVKPSDLIKTKIETKPKDSDDGAAPPPQSKISFGDREKEFAQSLVPHVPTYGKEMIRKFYDYWREPNRSKTKMRWERENTWDLNLRLQRWAANNFDKGQPEPATVKTNLSEVVKKLQEA